MSTTTFENDPEKGTNGKNLGPSSSPEWDTGVQVNAQRQPWNRRFIDSFKRDPNAHVTKESQRLDGEGGRAFDHRAAAERTANSGLAHKLKGRHMQMIAIGGSIGESRRNCINSYTC
jgi:yeast amino acid transporter